MARLRRYASLEVFGTKSVMNEISTYYHSPIGLFRLRSDGEKLTALDFCDETQAYQDKDNPDWPLPEVKTELDEYFAGVRKDFTVPVRFVGTGFQLRAWEALRDIPFGHTVSYQWQAQRIGSHPRPVGLANGRNPIPIIVPCHRVIGANGSLTGYGGGLWRKQILLNFESTVTTFGPCRIEELLAARNP
jgi:methylated-DNA-[protein]-cysteine S-methyltransferase